MDKKSYYSDTYMPGIIKWGKATMLLGIITMFLPPWCSPPSSAIGPPSPLF